MRFTKQNSMFEASWPVKDFINYGKRMDATGDGQFKALGGKIGMRQIPRWYAISNLYAWDLWRFNTLSNVRGEGTPIFKAFR